MKTKLLSFAAATALLAVSCAKNEVVQVNPDPEGAAISFTPSVDRATRATEITINNLGDFGVYARSMYPNHDLYDAFLIGSEDGPEIAKFSSKDDNAQKGFWRLERNVYWPSDVHTVLFWGVTTRLRPSDTAPTDVLAGNGKLVFEPNGPKLVGFAPKRAGRDAAVEYSDGADQQDLVVAFTAAESSSSNKVQVPMTFQHALAQVDIKVIVGAGQPADNRRVRIKGAWIVNACSTGELDSGFSISDNQVTETHKWVYGGVPTAYGSLFAQARDFHRGSEASSILSFQGNGSLMLIPQAVKPWNKTDEVTTNAYILLLCRIDLEHPGAEHGAETTGNGKHYHQLFPALKEGEPSDDDQYGYTCVPVDIKWDAGKKYTYTLNICGAASGAGVYPPQIPDDLPKIGPVVPDGKKPGQPVLDDPITFTVEVSAWDSEDKEWEPGM